MELSLSKAEARLNVQRWWALGGWTAFSGVTVLQVRRFCTLAALLLAGCQPTKTQQLPFGFVRGGALTAQEYARLEPLARSQSTTVRVTTEQAPLSPMVTSIYAFAPGFDPQQITRVEVGRFDGKSGEAAKVAAELPNTLTKLLTKRGLPASTASTGTPETYVISGTVTRAEPEDSPMAGTQAEAKIARGSTTVGFMQVNSQVLRDSVLYGAPPALLMGSLIGQAYAPGRIDILSSDISNALKQARAGKREGVVNNPNGPHMWLKETGP